MAMCSEIQLVTGPVIIVKGRSFCGEIKITDTPARTVSIDAV